MDKRNLSNALADCFARAASRTPETLFLVGPEPLSYGELLDRIARLTGFFRESGLHQGNRVVIATNDDGAAIVLFLAMLRNGLTAVPIDPLASAGEAAALIAAADAQGLFIDAELHATWRPREEGCTVLIRKPVRKKLLTRLLGRQPDGAEGECSYPGFLERQAPAEVTETVSDGIDAYILFTSGTTSRPKGVRISRGALASHLGTLSRQFGYGDTSRILNILPLHHADGMIQGPLVAFFNGATLYRPMVFSIQALPALLDTLYGKRITHFVAVPTMLALMLRTVQGYEDSFSSPEFYCVISTAAHLDLAVWEGFQSRFNARVANVYGLTETVAGSFFSGPDRDSHRPGTIGKAVDCQARIVDTDGTELPRGATGELLLSGAHLMSGYLNDPAGTEQSLRDGWLHTGDLAVRDEDDFYRIVGRKKNLIISGGFNIQPEEVSECLACHRGVLEAVTFGVADDVWGERVISCVVPSGPLPPAENDLVEYLRGRLTPFKVPARIHVLGELPRGPSGKVIIDRVREALAATSATVGELAGTEVADRIISRAALCFRVARSGLSIDASQNATPGWDSLAHLEFIVALEHEFGIRLTSADIIRIASLRDAERVVLERKGA